jgi:pilus assembly protein CpaB
MRNKRLIIAIAAAIVFGLIAAVSVSRYLASAQSYTRNLNNVVVAKVDIAIGERIIAEQLAVVQLPRSAAPDGTFSKIDENLVGRVAVTRIAAREPVTEGRLAPLGSAAGLSSVIPEGFRAMNVRVDDVVGISGFIMPGALVDVVVVIETPDDKQRERVSKIVLQNIKVLANGANLDKPKNEKEVERVKTVTLQVTPEQAEKLALASSEGRLQLVMRNSIDQGDEVTSGATKKSLLSGERAQPVPEPGLGSDAKPAPRASASAPRRPRPRLAASETAVKVNTPAPAPVRPSIEVIEGAKKKNVDFP